MAGPHELYLIRHGVAEERGDDWPDDAKRPLSADGMARMRRAARGLARLGVTFDVVLTSPLVRTRQTADIVAGVFSPGPPVEAVASLAPGGSFQGVLADLQKHAHHESIALVGHEPGIGEIAGRLLGSRHTFEFKKGAVCRIDVDSLPPTEPGTLLWFLAPRILRAIQK